MPKNITDSDLILFAEPSANGPNYRLLKPNQITGRKYNNRGAYSLVETLALKQTRIRATPRAKQQLKQYESQKPGKNLVDSLECPGLESVLRFLPQGSGKLIDFNYENQ